jgi:hypothetical protein
MSLEHNRDSLKKALQQLRSYDPPAHNWARIGKSLSQPVAQDEQVLQDAVHQLSAYTPPTKVWNHLSKELDEVRTHKHSRVVRRRQILQWAAALALLLSTTYIAMREPGPSVTTIYGEETVLQFTPDIDWDGEQALFAQLEEQLENIDDPFLNRLRFEYEELSEAYESVTAMLKSYGHDPQLIRQMADIERERSDIYRQIIEAR